MNTNGSSRDGRLHVLIAEDDIDNADMTALLLKQEGYEVRIAHNGHAALAAAEAEPPDVALIDIGMPGMDGYCLTEKLRALHAPKRPLIIAISGYGMDSDKDRSLKAGIDVHLVKPADPELLLRTLRRFAGLLQKGTNIGGS
jgi:CheY-like chemotaxis protein